MISQTWSCNKISLVNDLFDDDYVRMAAISPDGKLVAGYALHNIFLLDPDAEKLKVYSFPEEVKSVHGFTWSADSRYITFTENFHLYFHEPDIWLWDTKTGVFLDLTSDGSDNFDLNDFGKNDSPVDILPFFDRDGKYIWFLRLVVKKNVETAQLMRISVSGGKPELIYDFKKKFGLFDIYEGVMTFSHDYSKICLPVIRSQKIPSYNGLWILDLKRKKLDQICSVMEVEKQIPDSLKTKFKKKWIFGGHWTQKDKGILFLIFGFLPESGISFSASFSLLFHYSFSNSKLTALDNQLNDKYKNDGINTFQTRSAFITLDGTMLFVLGAFGEKIELRTAKAPDFMISSIGESITLPDFNLFGFDLGLISIVSKNYRCVGDVFPYLFQFASD
ncbi:MAG: hypothetical protein JW969_10710 [Spirochaetales bacterium]|nr:hypothetical protein [Spirochaetales bacterium]